MKNLRPVTVSLFVEPAKTWGNPPWCERRHILTEYTDMPVYPHGKYTEYLEVSKNISSVIVSSGRESTIIIHPETIPMLIKELRRVYKQFEKES